MKLALSRAALATILLTALAAPASALEVNLSSTPEAKTAYILRDFYGFPENDVVMVQRARPTDAATILEIARSTRTLPAKVLDLRERGFSFADILIRLGTTPSIFFVEIPPSRADEMGPPYGKAWGYWRKHGDRWPRDLVISDADLVRINDVKLHSLYFHEDPYQVVRAHAASNGQTVILRTFDEKKLGGKSAKAAKAAPAAKGPEPQDDGGKGKAKGQDKSHGKGKGK